MLSTRGRWALGFVPFGLLLAGVFVVPGFIFVRLAFENGFADWSDFFSADAKVDGLIRTVVIALETAVICALLGYVYTCAIVRATPRWRALLLGLVVLPFLTSILIRTYGWIVVLGNQGPINEVLRAIGGDDAGASLLYNRTGLIIGMVHIMLPFFVLPLYSVWSQLPSDVSRAARTLGANRLEAFLRVELPLTFPGAAAGAILVFITSLGFFITPALLGGEGDTMVSQYIDRELAVSVDLNDAAVLGTVLLAAVLLVLAAFRVVYPIELLFVQDARTARARRGRVAHAGAAVARAAGTRMRRALQLRLRATAALSRLPWGAMTKVGAAAIAVFLVTPLLIVIPVSLTAESFLHFPPDGLSLRWFEDVLGDPSWRFAAFNSLLTGLMATALALAAGLPVAFALARSRMGARLKGLVMLLTTLPVIMPLIVLALATYAWFLDAQLVGNQFALAAAQALLGLPFVVVIVLAALRDFDVRLERAARSLGADALTTWRVVTIPLIRRAILAGLLFAFLQSFDELLIARAVTNVDTYTLPVKMWNGANEEISPALGAVSVLSLLLTALAVIALSGVRRASARRSA